MDKIFYNTAVNYLKAGEIFKTISGYGSRKAEELLVSSFVNVWLGLQKDSRQLKLNSKPTGVDGYVIDNGLAVAPINALEIKTSQNGGTFQFGRHFLKSGFIHGTSKTVLNENQCDFDNHLMVVCAILKNSVIKTVYIAYGPDVMRQLAMQLGDDTIRPGFIIQRPKKADTPLLYASHHDIREAALTSKVKNYPLEYPKVYTLPKGLNDLADDYSSSLISSDNWVKKLDNNDKFFKEAINLLTKQPPDEVV